MSKLGMSKLKGLLQEIAVRLSADGSASFQTVIDEVRRNHPEAIRAVHRVLEDASMRRMLAEIATRRPAAEGAADLFAPYPGVHQFVTVKVERDGRLGTELMYTLKSKISAVEAWLNEDRPRPASRREQNPGIVQMVRDARAAAGDADLTIEEALGLARRAKATAKKARG